MQQRGLVIVTGPVGGGKSTVAFELARSSMPTCVSQGPLTVQIAECLAQPVGRLVVT